ncbi:hypothetical protein [Pontibacter roseus]|uniref:hypothetical protein n=1 Tax=Pontibacter roseus TaxID=336989 RepID=UPI00039B31E7|nr:hypothetical protein [Pontibacter roseus]
MGRIRATVSGLTAAACLLLFSACNDCSTSVSQFENGDSTWTVYAAQDSLQMLAENDTVYTFVNVRTSSEPVPGEGFDVTDACIEQYDTRRVSVMQQADTPRRFPALTVIAQRRPNDIQVSLAVAGRGTLLIPDVNTPQHASLPVNGFTYTNVFDVAAADSTGSDVKRILFNREFGFLQVEFFRGRTLKRVANP